MAMNLLGWLLLPFTRLFQPWRGMAIERWRNNRNRRRRLRWQKGKPL